MRKFAGSLCCAAILGMMTPALADPSPYTYPGTANTRNSSALYDSQGNYVRPQTLSPDDQVWQDEDGNLRCKRKNGTTGLVIGAALGGLLGNQIAGRGDKTLGTILGAVGGGLLGRAIEKGKVKCK